jgi:plasmid maintenance system killer protein
MEISFNSNRLEKNFNSDKLLQRTYGQNAKKIKQRMAVLNAANHLGEVPTIKPDRCHPLIGDRKGQFAVDLIQPARLIFIPNQDPIPKKPDGGMDLEKILKIKILEVEEDYH